MRPDRIKSGRLSPLRHHRDYFRRAKGVDTCARDYALSHGIKITEYLPEYEKFGRTAPLKRNITIIQNSDLVLAFWDGKSKGTKFVIDSCERLGVGVRVVLLL